MDFNSASSLGIINGWSVRTVPAQLRKTRVDDMPHAVAVSVDSEVTNESKGIGARSFSVWSMHIPQVTEHRSPSSQSLTPHGSPYCRGMDAHLPVVTAHSNVPRQENPPHVDDGSSSREQGVLARAAHVSTSAVTTKAWRLPSTRNIRAAAALRTFTVTALWTIGTVVLERKTISMKDIYVLPPFHIMVALHCNHCSYWYCTIA
mmetsp:Transcript_42166/g.88508  ORF Transcript_42166/g.88508 Transcript_42166/m.88508 type:complete len:204 (+) Transcript_42166:1961-2572(+)